MAGTNKGHRCTIGSATCYLLIYKTHPHRRGRVDLVGIRKTQQVCRLARQPRLYKVHACVPEAEQPIECWRGNTLTCQGVAPLDPVCNIVEIIQRIAAQGEEDIIGLNPN